MEVAHLAEGSITAGLSGAVFAALLSKENSPAATNLFVN